MRRTLVATAILVGIGAFAVGASAALPKKGATYAGDIKSSPFVMHIDMTVSATGKKLSHFTYLCGTGRAPQRCSAYR
jgi:hypothetical protein